MSSHQSLNQFSCVLERSEEILTDCQTSGRGILSVRRLLYLLGDNKKAVAGGPDSKRAVGLHPTRPLGLVTTMSISQRAIARTFTMFQCKHSQPITRGPYLLQPDTTSS